MSKVPAPPLSETELARVDARVCAALAVVNGRCPSATHDHLVAVSDWCWSQRRDEHDVDGALPKQRRAAP